MSRSAANLLLGRRGGASPRSTSATRRSPLFEALVLAFPVAVLALMAWQRRWMSDDGFVNLRVVDQLLAGNGPVFNAGERVEAGTSPLWILILAVGDVVTPLRLEWFAVLAGIALSLLGVGAAVVASARLWRRAAEGVLLPIGAVSLVVLSPFWDFSSSGLEGGLSFFWLGVSLVLLQRWAEHAGRGAGVASLVAGLGPLVRPDLVVLSSILVVVLQLGERGASARRRLTLLVLAAAAPVAYGLFRAAYFGALMPNTYYAKEGGDASWSQGWLYLRDLFGPYWLWVPLAVLVAAGLAPLVVTLRRQGERRALLVVLAFPLGGLLTAVAVVRGGGDFMHARLLLPSLFAIVAPVAAVAVRGRTALSLVVLPWAAICLVTLRPPGFAAERLSTVNDHRSAMHALLGGAEHAVTLEDFGYAEAGANHVEFDPRHRLYEGQRPVEVAGRPVPLARGAPERVLLAYGVGAISYFVGPDTYVLDMLGLGDALTARLELDRRGTLPGHEKALPPAWVWARFVDPGVRPDPALLGPPEILLDTSPTLASLGPPEDLAADVDAARTALSCADIADLEAAISEPLAPDRLAANVVHAITSFRERVPPRPTEARRALCPG